MPKKIKVACFGDSLTKGNVSYNWVKQLSNDFAARDVSFTNFGENGELAYNLLQRIGDIIASQPDVVILLVGSNDAMGSLNDENRKFYMEREKLPRAPSLDFFAENLFSLAGILKDKTSARVVCVTIPPLGEVLDDHSNQVVNRHNEEIKKLCQSYDFQLLDLNSNMKSYYTKHQDLSPYLYNSDRALILKAAAKKYLLFRSWNKVTKSHGMILSHDGVHLNETSGGILAGLVSSYLTLEFDL